MKKNPNEKSSNQNPRLVISFDSTDLFTPSGDLKKMILGIIFPVKENLPFSTSLDYESFSSFSRIIFSESQ